MRKWLLAGMGAAVLAAPVAFLAGPAWLRARAPGHAAEGPAKPAVQLPLGQVVLFSSGVGYFQREGTIDGDARVDLNFPITDINDLIKSMVVRDLDGGSVSSVSYDFNVPLERKLRSFGVNLHGNPTFADILQQTRGEKAEVVLAGAGAGTITGTIAGVERQKQSVGNEVVEVQALNLWCADGMRSLRMTEVQRVRFLEPRIEEEFRKALEALTGSHDTQKKAVSIRFQGEGKRRVRVSYVVESPVWKTSYRLVLPAGGKEKPYLQGWAVVENPSDEDWKDVRLGLVLGRPISFQMDLYQLLYAPRPVVVPELFHGLQPVAYSGAVEKPAEKLGGIAPPEKQLEVARMRYQSIRKANATVRNAVNADDEAAAKAQLELEEARAWDLAKGVSAAASAARLGDYYRYSVEKPVSLARQKSALLPIVGKDVQVQRVSIYNERVLGKFPLLGLRFKNTSGTHLMQGPITIYEGQNYAGDARMQDLQPGEERLVSYAIDLGTEISPAPGQANGRVAFVKAVKGVLQMTTKQVESRVYTAKNRSEQERTLLIEHPVRNEFKLVDCKPAETAADVYRFELKVPAGTTKVLDVREEQVVESTVAITTHPDEQMRLLLREQVLSRHMKAGLEKALALRGAAENTRKEVADLQKQFDAIVEDQKRLRANLKEVPQTAKAYKRYVEKFDQQETEIEALQGEVKKKEATLNSQQKAFEDFLAGFTAE